MTFDLNASIVTIGPFEPAMLVSIVLAVLGAFGLGRALASVTARVDDPWRRVVYLGPVWLVAGLLMFVLPNVVVAVLYPVFHPEDRGATVCVAMVWPLFLAAPVVGYSVAGTALRRRHAT
jgi:hypothetical protein